MNEKTESGFLHPYIRVLNASDYGNVDFYMFNTMIAGCAEHGYFGSYVKCERGMTTFRVCPKNNPDFALASLAIKLDIGQVYTICAVGTGKEVSMYAIEEPCKKSNLEYGHLRICDLWMDSGKKNVYANDVCFVAELSYPNITRYVEMKPGNYEIELRDSKTADKRLNCDEQSIRAGKYNSLYILPPKDENSEPTSIFTVDAASYNGFYL